MRISWSQLDHLPVKTQSGQAVGVIEGVTVDVDLHTVSKYEVKPAKVLVALFSKALLISPSQVISLSSKVMIVDDSVSAKATQTTSEKTRLTLATADSDAKMSDIK